MAQVRALLRQPEIVVGTWMTARAEAPDLTEGETREALEHVEPLWDTLFPAEQARIIRLLVDGSWLVLMPRTSDCGSKDRRAWSSDLAACMPNALRQAAGAGSPLSTSGRR